MSEIDESAGAGGHPGYDADGDEGHSEDLTVLEDDLDSVDAALEALDADDLDTAESLVAKLTDDPAGDDATIGDGPGDRGPGAGD